MNTNCNYDLLFEQITKQTYAFNPPKLLLHVCCAPCATYCLTRILPFFKVTLFYSNDNITDEREWNKRLEEVKKLTDIINGGRFETKAVDKINLITPPFDSAKFFSASKGLENEREGGLRCNACFLMRLKETADYAQNNGFDMFGTTLTVSPYKNSKLINETGLQLQSDNLRWLTSDFKKRGGYNESVRLSEKYGLYRQHYCGCCFSLAQMQEKTTSD